MSRSFRQEQILKLVRAQPIHSQGELARVLRRQGLATSQVTLSRDMRELGLLKTPHGYSEAQPAPPAPLHATGDLDHVLREFGRDLRQAQQLAVLKTVPGTAATVAAALDAAAWTELAGSLAGDDTVLLICGNSAEARKVVRLLRQLMST